MNRLPRETESCIIINTFKENVKIHWTKFKFITYIPIIYLSS